MPTAYGTPGAMPRSPYAGSFSSMESSQGMSPPARFGGGPMSNSSVAQGKPFSNNYHPAPAVSPYYSMLTTDTRGGTVDPYTSIVQPQLQQQQQNTQFNNDINTLQNQYQLVAPEQNANRGQGDASGYQIDYSRPGGGQ